MCYFLDSRICISIHVPCVKFLNVLATDIFKILSEVLCRNARHYGIWKTNYSLGHAFENLKTFCKY